MITTYHIAILTAVATYYTLTRAQIQALCCPRDRDGRMTRKRLLQLVQAGLLNRTRMEVVNPLSPEGPMPVYYPSRKGLELLAAHTGDERWMEKTCLTPNWQHLLHWVTVARFHILLDQAIAIQPLATLGGYLGEWDIANPEETEPHKRYRLFTRLQEKPRLVCNPDSAFLLCVGAFKKIHYVEIDRETSGVNQVAHSKTPGYSALLQQRLHLKHLPSNTSSFWVLSVSPSPQRRDLLIKAMQDRPGRELWKFASWTDLSKDTLLLGPVWHRCTGERGPLVKTAEGGDDGQTPGSAEGPAPIRHGPGAEREAV